MKRLSPRLLILMQKKFGLFRMLFAVFMLFGCLTNAYAQWATIPPAPLWNGLLSNAYTSASAACLSELSPSLISSGWSYTGVTVTVTLDTQNGTIGSVGGACMGVQVNAYGTYAGQYGEVDEGCLPGFLMMSQTLCACPPGEAYFGETKSCATVIQISAKASNKKINIGEPYCAPCVGKPINVGGDPAAIAIAP